MEEHINVAITAFNSCEETHAARLAQAVEAALLDMKALLEDGGQWWRTRQFCPARPQAGQQEVTRRAAGSDPLWQSCGQKVSLI